MSKYNLSMKNNAISLISRIREQANKFIINELEENGIKGIVPSHGDIMAVLYSCEKCTMKELAQKIHRTKATLTVLVDKLIALNLVEKEKSDTDSRVTFIKLTEKGKSCRQVFEDISNKLNLKLFKDFSDQEIETFSQLLEKARHNIT